MLFHKYVLFITENGHDIYYSVRKDFERYQKDVKFFDTLGDARRSRSYLYKYGIADKSENVKIRSVNIKLDLGEIIK